MVALDPTVSTVTMALLVAVAVQGEYAVLSFVCMTSIIIIMSQSTLLLMNASLYI